MRFRTVLGELLKGCARLVRKRRAQLIECFLGEDVLHRLADVDLYACGQL